MESVDDATETTIRRMVQNLRVRQPRLDVEIIEGTVRDIVAAFDGAKVRDYVGVLAEKAARDRLRQFAPGG